MKNLSIENNRAWLDRDNYVRYYRWSLKYHIEHQGCACAISYNVQMFSWVSVGDCKTCCKLTWIPLANLHQIELPFTSTRIWLDFFFLYCGIRHMVQSNSTNVDLPNNDVNFNNNIKKVVKLTAKNRGTFLHVPKVNSRSINQTSHRYGNVLTFLI